MHAPGREQRDALVAGEPRRGLGGVARVGVLRKKHDEPAPELLVERGEDERQDGLRHPRARRQGSREQLQPLLRAEALDKCVEHWLVHDDRPNCAFGGGVMVVGYRSLRAPSYLAAYQPASGSIADPRATVRRVDEAAGTDVDPDVTEAVEEDEVTRPQPRARHAATEPGLAVGPVRQHDPEMRVDETGEARAVEATRRRGAAVGIRLPRNCRAKRTIRACSRATTVAWLTGAGRSIPATATRACAAMNAIRTSSAARARRIMREAPFGRGGAREAGGAPPVVGSPSVAASPAPAMTPSGGFSAPPNGVLTTAAR